MDSYNELLALTGRSPGVEEDDAGIDRFWNQVLTWLIECFPENVDEYDIELFMIERRTALRAMFTRWQKARRVIVE